MALFGWFRRLFTRTASEPPPSPPGYQPAGLERPDPPETLAPPPPIPESSAPDRQTDGAAATELPPGVVDIVVVDHVLDVPLEPSPRQADAAPKRPRRGRETDGFGEAVDDDVYGLTFAIEYESAGGDFSRRRIMLRAISVRDDGAVFLRALCFERNALRSFRLDRVLRIIDADGVVHDNPAAFLRDELRLNLSAPRAAAERPNEALPAPAELATAGKGGASQPGPTVAPEPDMLEKPGMAQRRVARDGLRVLCALARTDGVLHPTEVEVVLDYIEAACRASGEPCSAADRAALAPYVRRQRPGLDVLEGCVQRIEAGNKEGRTLLLDHAARLIIADGQEHEAELRMLAEIRG
jgi:hypothetical protein